jgi:hypothetical protein
LGALPDGHGGTIQCLPFVFGPKPKVTILRVADKYRNVIECP